MSSVFDYYYYLMNLAVEPNPDENTGLLVKLPDRHADRKRAGDVFFALLTLEGGAAITADQQNGLLEKAADRYFSSSGSVTAGIRAAVEPINKFLYARNLRSSSEGKQAAGILNIGVLHSGVAIVAHAGPTHTFFLTNAHVTDNTDPGADRGLGFSRSSSLRFFQDSIDAGDIILFCPKPPTSWTPALLAGAPQLNRNILRRRLLHQVNGELRTGVIEFQAGNGELHPLRLRPGQASGSVPAMPAQSVEQPLAALRTQVAPPAAPVVPQPALTQAERVSDLKPREEVPSAAHTQMTRPMTAEPEETPEIPHVARTPRRRRSGFQAWLANFFKQSRSTQKRVGTGLTTFAGRLLPESGEKTPHLSNLSLLLVAIAIPVLIVALATTIYIRSGRDEQQKALVYVAQQIADQAVNATGAESQRFAWQEVLKQLGEAEKYGQSEPSRTLRQQAQSAVDKLDGIKRLEYSPAMAGGFDSQVAFTQLVTSPSGDLYALDALIGRVIRFESTQNGYVLDRAFTCGPNQIGAVIVGPLVDIAPLPRNNPFNASILGIDANGTLEFCSSEDGKTDSSATTLVSDHGWGKITAITLYDGALYVLDPINNVVWRYDSLSNNFANAPHPLEIVVQDLINTMDISIYEDDLFLLHTNGQTTKCTYRSPFSWEMECKEPAPYIINDADQNRLSFNTLAGAQLTQMQTTYPLEPSLFILDQANNAVYRFSVAMQMQYKMSPSLTSRTTLPATSATAFTVNGNQQVILAFNNQLFIADLPMP